MLGLLVKIICMKHTVTGVGRRNERWAYSTPLILAAGMR